jgi:hypothetical protein
MCNAWNHSPGCTCGFGGDGHLGGSGSYGLLSTLESDFYKRIYEKISYSQLRIDKTRYESYVNPNAVCPVCGASVYFYQSPDGGRVFFDDLGPPWPKHPCTDNKELPARNQQTNNARPTWTEHGWVPIDSFAPTLIDGQYLIKGYLLRENRKELIQDYLISEDSDFKNSDLKFYRDIDHDRFEIIYLNLKNERIGKIIGHKRESAIRLGLGRHIPIEIGEELALEFRGIDLGLRIQVTPVDRFTSVKCFIDKRDLKEETIKKLKVVPHIKFVIKGKVISTKKEIILKEV